MNKTFFKVVFAVGGLSSLDFSDLTEARAKIAEFSNTTGEYAKYWREVADNAKLYEVNQTLTEIGKV